MLTFEEIEGCFPDGACSDATGKMLVSAQWLHDFAHAVSAKEREACATECEAKHANGNWMYDTRHECADAIRARFAL